MKGEISNDMDYIQISDIMERIREIESDDDPFEYEKEELESLKSLLDQCSGFEGTLIRDSEFKEYCENMASDQVGDIPDWIYFHIDWQGISDDVRSNYTSVDFDGVDYLINY